MLTYRSHASVLGKLPCVTAAAMSVWVQQLPQHMCVCNHPS